MNPSTFIPRPLVIGWGLTVLTIGAFVSFYEGYISILASILLYFTIGIIVVRLISASSTETVSTPASFSMLSGLFTFNYFLRVFIAMAYYYLLILERGEPYLPGGDDFTFDQLSRGLARDWIGGFFHVFDRPDIHDTPAFIHILSFGYLLAHYLGGIHGLTAIFLVAAAGSLVPVYIYLIARERFDERLAGMVAVVSTFYPEFIHYSSVLLRDMLVCVLILFSIRHFFLMQTRHPLRNLTWVLVGILLLSTLRTGSAAFLLLILGVIFLGTYWPRWSRIAHLGSLLGLAGLAGLLYTNILTLILSSPDLDIARITITYLEMSMEISQSGSIGAMILRLPPPLKEIIYTGYYIIAPFPPWNYVNVTSIFLGIGAVFWYILAFFWLIGMFYCIYEKKYVDLVFMNAMYFAVLANTVLDVRHRTQIMPLAFIIATYGFVRYQKLVATSVFSYKSLITVGSLVLLMTLLLVYSYLKFLA